MLVSWEINVITFTTMVRMKLKGEDWRQGINTEPKKCHLTWSSRKTFSSYPVHFNGALK